MAGGDRLEGDDQIALAQGFFEQLQRRANALVVQIMPARTQGRPP